MCLASQADTRGKAACVLPCAGLSEAMLEEGPWQLGELGQKYMKTIKTSAIHLASLINDILDAAAATKGSLAIKLEQVNWCCSVHFFAILLLAVFSCRVWQVCAL